MVVVVCVFTWITMDVEGRCCPWYVHGVQTTTRSFFALNSVELGRQSPPGHLKVGKSVYPSYLRSFLAPTKVQARGQEQTVHLQELRSGRSGRAEVRYLGREGKDLIGERKSDCD